MSDYVDIAITSFDKNRESLKPHRFFEWSQHAHEKLSAAMPPVDGLLWVYSRHRARWSYPCDRVTVVRLRTWLSDIQGAFATREFTTHDADTGQLLFERQTTSVALDQTTLRPSKADLMHLRNLIAGPSSSLDKLDAESISPDASFRFERHVEFDDLDRYAHVNNAAYLRWTTDALTRHAWEENRHTLTAHRLRDIDIRYLHPLKMQDSFCLEGSRTLAKDGAQRWRIEMRLTEGRPVANVTAVMHDIENYPQ